MNPILIEISARLYDHLIFGQGRVRDMALKGYLEDGTPFGLERDSFDNDYREFIPILFEIPAINENWSETAVQGEVFNLLSNFASQKWNPTNVPNERPRDVEQIISEWLNRFSTQFTSKEYYVPIKGLVVDAPITVGRTTFWPLLAKQAELAQYELVGFFDDLSPARDCIASSAIAAESQKAVQILSERVEGSLAIIRYLGAHVWWEQPKRHIYRSGAQPERIWQAVELDPGISISQLGQSNYPPNPIQIGEEYLPYFNFWGLDGILQMAGKDDPSAFERILLNSIRWFGDAIQDMRPLSAFMKFYTAMESLVKQQRENAMNVVPKRISILLDPYDSKQQRDNYNLTTKLIRERNSVFHEGLPAVESPEYLAWISQILSKNSIHQMISLVNRYHWKNRSQFIEWVNDPEK